MGRSTRIERELMRGAGPLAVLHLLARRERYGWELAAALEEESAGLLAMGHSTLYPLLYNLEDKGLITSREGVAESGRVRRYYAITPRGRKALEQQRGQWELASRALTALGVLSPAERPS